VPDSQLLGKPVGAFVITNKVATMLAGVSSTA
jgi:hypothetical protein